MENAFLITNDDTREREGCVRRILETVFAGVTQKLRITTESICYSIEFTLSSCDYRESNPFLGIHQEFIPTHEVIMR